VRGWDASRVARAAGARLEAGPAAAVEDRGPLRATVDSRAARAGDLFVGLRGERADGGEHAPHALRAGAWGALVEPRHARAALAARTGGAVLAHPDPLAGLHALARAWRGELQAGGTRVVAITGSTGKTSTKDILAAILAGPSAGPATSAVDRPPASAADERAGGGLRTVSSPENLNTEIGLPLAVLSAQSDTEVLVLEMAMRGAGQIAELTAIAEPDVGVIVNVGPVHLELLGTVEAVAAAKAELIAGLTPGATAVLPVHEPLLEQHLRGDLRTVTFGEGGDFWLQAGRPAGGVVIRGGARPIALQPSFRGAHNMRNLLAAVAAASALGVTPQGPLEVRFSPLRGERHVLRGGVVLINDCYNANPMSMRAAIDDLADTAPARRVAVLGDMLELGPEAARFHREIGEYAGERGVELLLTVGPLAAEMHATFTGEAHSAPDASAAAELLSKLLRERDTVLVKGSRGLGLERVAEGLGARSAAAGGGSAETSALAPTAAPGRS
jgi:UDP-N-acetylmuramoyl-tripeptide--D-alanyl-D-alanine ligase